MAMTGARACAPRAVVPALLGLLVLAPAPAASGGLDLSSNAGQEALSTDGAESCGEPALGLAQLRQRALLAPRAGGRRGGSSPLPPIAFVKTHKTGGSTLANIIYRLAATRNLSFTSPTTRGVLRWDVLEQTMPPAHQFDVTAVHQMFNETAVRAYLRPSSPFFFSSLREPVARTDSDLRFLAGLHGTEHYPLSWDERLVLMAERRLEFLNPLARDLGWYNGVDISRPWPGDHFVLEKDNDERAVASFIDYIDRTMDLVILTELFDEGLVLLMHKLNLTLDDITNVRMKESFDFDVAPPTAEQLRTLEREYFSVDKALYDHFVKRFWREWEEHGGDTKLGQEVAALQARNDELVRVCSLPDALREVGDTCPEIVLMDGPEMRSYLSGLRIFTNPTTI